ncbi:hypothetical protein FRX31_028543 [Thalictrum thalictroides]|uniref:DUF4283 domain-containing protein n=1 Tax=Thalictrum thalictroides TaxID=46969 RepID=A0A7J6VCB5_THATH|nr:hypothetical protein FRX31_028543 [Thalictrum thalictroides]
MVGRSSYVVVVEGKSFELQQRQKTSPEEEIAISEKRRGKLFNGTFSIGGVRWVGKLMCQISVLTPVSGTLYKFQDKWSSIQASVLSNHYGLYLQCFISLKHKNKGAACLCFPARKNCEGWTNLGARIRDLTEGKSRSINSTPPTQVYESRLHPNSSYAQVCANVNPKPPSISVQSLAGGLGEIWWSNLIIGRYEGSKPDWFWARDKIRAVCGEVVIKTTDEGIAVLDFHDLQAKNKLLSLPALRSWDGVYSFKQWHPSDGMLSESQMFGDFQVTFYGIPLHLRIKEVVESLAGKCGKNFCVDHDSIEIWKSECSATIKGGDWRLVPLVIVIQDGIVAANVRVGLSSLGKKVISDLIGEVPERSPISLDRPVPAVDHVVAVLDSSHVAKGSTSDASFPPGFGPAPSHLSSSPHVITTGINGSFYQRSTNPFLDDLPANEKFLSPNRFHPFSTLSEEAILCPQPESSSVHSAPPLVLDPILPEQKWQRVAEAQRQGQWRNASRPTPNGPRLVEIGQSSSQRPTPSAPRQTNLLSFRPPMDIVSEQCISTPSQLDGPSREELISSFLSCKTEEDFRRWIRWMVIPLSSQLGVSSSVDQFGQENLFTQLGRSTEGQNWSSSLINQGNDPTSQIGKPAVDHVA